MEDNYYVRIDSDDNFEIVDSYLDGRVELSNCGRFTLTRVSKGLYVNGIASILLGQEVFGDYIIGLSSFKGKLINSGFISKDMAISFITKMIETYNSSVEIKEDFDLTSF